MWKREAADAEIAGHHTLSREHLENAQDFFALTEAIEENAHRADIDDVRSAPHQMAVQARELGKHDARPLRQRRDFKSEQFLGCQAVNQVVRERGKVIDA